MNRLLRRIAVVSEVSFPQVDGMSNTIQLLLSYLAEMKIQTMLIAPEKRGQEPNTVPENAVYLSSYNLPWYSDYQIAVPSSRVETLLDRFNPDVIHVANPVLLGTRAIKYARENLRPVIASFHTFLPAYAARYRLGIVKPLAWLYLRYVHNKCMLNLSPSRSFASLMRKKGIRGVALWERGVDFNIFNPSKRNMAVRRRLMRDASNVLLIYVGRLAREKEVELLRCCVTGIDEVELIIVGDGPRRSWLEQWFANTQTKFLGYQRGDFLAQIYASADIFMSPSSTETFGQTILEAMASGLPVVAVDSFGVRDQIHESAGGIIVTGELEASLQRAVMRLVNDEALRDEMSRCGRAYALTKPWRRSFTQLLNHYKSVVLANRSKAK